MGHCWSFHHGYNYYLFGLLLGWKEGEKLVLVVGFVVVVFVVVVLISFFFVFSIRGLRLGLAIGRWT